LQANFYYLFYDEKLTMSKARFTNQQLYRLRNNIPVEALIERQLNVASKITKGCFRFRCPLCNEFNTAVNTATNLARCFSCKKNYNTIDLVMLIRQTDFVQSVKFLKNNCKAIFVNQNHSSRQTVTQQASEDNAMNESGTQTQKSNNMLKHIGQVLGHVIAKRDYSEKQLVNRSRKQTIAVQHNTVNDRILKLEQKVEYLVYQIEKMASSIHTEKSFRK
jgi:DNA primase